MKRVLIIQAQMKEYRLAFFQELHAALREDSIQLKVAYSDPSEIECQKSGTGELPPDLGIKVRGYWALRNKVLYQPLLREIAAADLVIAEHTNRSLLNYILLAMSTLSIKKVAFWGHGRNRNEAEKGFRQWLKRTTLRRADWWFAYTSGTANYLIRQGVSPEKITNAHNAVDTSAFRSQLSRVSQVQLESVRAEIGIGPQCAVGLFCGGLYPEKKLKFLIESARLINQNLPAFRLLILGAGPEKALIESAAVQERWIRYLGPRFGIEKATYFALANVFLMPGLVGLAILDAFAAGLPVLTTDIPIHSPEIEYLRSGQNGLVTEHNVEAYARAVVEILSEPLLLKRMKKGALESAQRYSVEVMVNNFRSGIKSCLSLDRSGTYASVSTAPESSGGVDR